MTQAFAIHEIGNTYEDGSTVVDGVLGAIPGILITILLVAMMRAPEREASEHRRSFDLRALHAVCC